jgi:hypothetical protein
VLEAKVTMVQRVREKRVAEGLAAALTRKKRATPVSGQHLDRRIADARSLTVEIGEWLTRRNAHNAKANWRFTTAGARIKLKSLYPAL